MNRTAATLSPLAAAAYVFTALNATCASAAVTTSHYQQTVTMVCASSCIAKFPQLAANQVMDIDHLACEVVATPPGVAVFAEVKLLPVSLKFSYPLDLQWQRTYFTSNVYTFASAVNIRVPSGKQVEVEVTVGGTPSGTCSLTGARLTSS
jgi:hypothetical protein